MSTENESTEGQPMSLLDVRDWLRFQHQAIDRLAWLGDKIALRVVGAYRYWYKHQEDERGVAELRAAVRDYMIREHDASERKEMAAKMEHKIN